MLGLDDLPAYAEPAETETTFEGNALIKARAAVARTGRIALADDSGIAVDRLNGMPGVRSARWAGPGATDAANNELLLRQLDDVPDPHRTAQFVCAMAMVAPDGTEVVATRRGRGPAAHRTQGREWVRLRPAVRARRARRRPPPSSTRPPRTRSATGVVRSGRS